MSRNSRKNPEMVAAADRLRELLSEAGALVDGAIKEWEHEPRWCGFVGSDASYRSDRWYPRYYRLWFDPSNTIVSKAYDKIDNQHPSAANEGPAKAFHIAAMRGVQRSLYGGISSKDANETPAAYLDRIRGELRYADRLDEKNTITCAFALLEVKKVGRPYDADDNGTTVRVQDYEYRPLPKQKVDVLTGVINLAHGLRRAFDHAALALLPKSVTDDERKFLDWVADKGGTVRHGEAMKWFSDNGSRVGGDSPIVLRKFCDKEGGAGSRKPWRVRPEALALIGR